MAHFNHFNVGIHIHPPLSFNTRVAFQQSPTPLKSEGLNLVVEISKANSILEKDKNKAKKRYPFLPMSIRELP